jgi:hypothetical protein
MTDRIKILCSNCRKPFGERAQRLRNGYQVQCPNRMKLITFDSSSEESQYQAPAEGGAGFSDGGGGSNRAGTDGGSSA